MSEFPKTLVTGGTGFIGSFLVEELKKKGHNVFVLTKGSEEGEKIINVDITNRNGVLDKVRGFDNIYHLAGVLGTSELNEIAHEASRVNILGTINILDAARANGAKVIHITKPNVWNNTYSITKYAGESFAKMYKDLFWLPTVSVKWFNVYGPNQSFHCQKAVPFFIEWALKDEDIEVWGDGEQTGDFIHAKDAVRATIAIAEDRELEGTTVDVGSGEETTVNDLAKMIIKLSGSKSKIVHELMRKGEDEGTRLKANMAVLDELGFKPEYDLKTGLKETINWYKEN